MKLYGVSWASKSQKILIAAEYAGVEVTVEEFFPRGIPEEALKEFKQKNPNGTVPVLETPEGFLFESNAILRYIARHNDNSKLYGSNTYERALVDQYLDWISLTLEPALGPVIYSYAGHRAYDKTAVTTSLETAKKLLRVVDDRVKQSKYLAGEQITIADIQLATTLAFVYRFIFDEKTRKPFHNLTKWYESVSNEENFKKVVGRPILCKTAYQPSSQ